MDYLLSKSHNMKKYIKDNIIKTAIEMCLPTIIDGQEMWLWNPTEDIILANGWEQYDNREEMYENRVVELIREKYSINRELAVLRQRNSKPEEFSDYDAFAEECKRIARIEIYGGES